MTSVARAVSTIAFTALRAPFTVTFFPLKRGIPRFQTRCIPAYITRLHREAQNPDAETGARGNDFPKLCCDYDGGIGGAVHMVSPVVRFRIDFAEHSSIGPGKIRLLEAIRDSGSLSQAARNIGMSYRRAWLLVESLRQSFREPVTVASTGGKDGGGMLVTEFGDALIESYRQLERDLATLTARSFHAIIPTVILHSKAGARTSIRSRL